MVEFLYILGCLFLMSFGADDNTTNTREHEPSFCEPYNFTCKFDHGMLVMLSFTSVDQTKTTTLYTSVEQHPTFPEFYRFDVLRDNNGIHVVFTIINVTAQRLGIYECVDDNTGLPVETHVINRSVSVAGTDDCYTNQKASGTNVDAVVIIVIVLASVIATTIVGIVMITLFIQKKPRLILPPPNESSRTTPSDQNETAKSTDHLTRLILPPTNESAGTTPSDQNETAKLPGVVSDTKESRTDNENRQPENNRSKIVTKA